MLSREEILSKTDLKKQVVNVPEWNGDVLVSEMSGEARDLWEQSLQERDSQKRIVNLRAKLIIACVVDEQGNRLFKDSDIAAISALSANSTDQICLVAQKLNKLLAEDLEASRKN